MRRLDHDLNRFTIELEADTAGITELLEQSMFAEYWIVLLELCIEAMATTMTHNYYISGSYLLDRPPTPEKPLTGHSKRTQF